MRNNFTFFKEYWEAIDRLSLTQQKDLVWAMAQLASGGKYEEILAKTPTKSAQNLLLSYRFSLENSKKQARNRMKNTDTPTSENKPNENQIETNRNRTEIEIEIENTSTNVEVQKTKSKWDSIDCFDDEEFQPLKEKISVDYDVPLAFVESKIDDMKNKRMECEKKYKYKDYYLALRKWVKKDAMQIRKEHNDGRNLIIGQF